MEGIANHKGSSSAIGQAPNLPSSNSENLLAEAVMKLDAESSDLDCK